jgi:hypothetical protein
MRVRHKLKPVSEALARARACKSGLTQNSLFERVVRGYVRKLSSGRRTTNQNKHRELGVETSTNTFLLPFLGLPLQPAAQSQFSCISFHLLGFFSRFSGGVFPLLFSGLPAPSVMSLLTALSQASCRSCEVWCGHLIFQPRARLHFASRSLARSLACRRGLSRGRFQHALWPIVSQTSPGRFTAPTATGSERAPRRWATPLCTHGRGWPAVFRNARE